MAERYTAEHWKALGDTWAAARMQMPISDAECRSAAADAEIVEALVAMEAQIRTSVRREEVLSAGRSPELDVLRAIAALVSQVPR